MHTNTPTVFKKCQRIHHDYYNTMLRITAMGKSWIGTRHQLGGMADVMELKYVSSSDDGVVDYYTSAKVFGTISVSFV